MGRRSLGEYAGVSASGIVAAAAAVRCGGSNDEVRGNRAGDEEDDGFRECAAPFERLGRSASGCSLGAKVPPADASCGCCDAATAALTTGEM